MTIGVYARVSTDEQARSGYSLQDQVRECKRKAGTDKVIEYVDDGWSGEFLDRPGLSKLREDLRSGTFEKVICYDPDRLSRRLQHQLIITEEIDKYAELVFVNHNYQRTPEGQLFYQLRGSIAEFEKAKINERMSRGRREKARQGRVLRDFRVYGYSYDQNIEQFVVNEAEATVVRLIFDLFTKPNDLVRGINSIAKYLTDQGFPTKRGAKIWHRQVVRQILMNRAYIGEFYQNRWNTEGMLKNRFSAAGERVKMTLRPREEWIRLDCPPIIPVEQFEHAQDLLEQSRRRWAGSPKRQYLLSGLLRCGHCNNTMTGRRSKNWNKYKLEYTDRKNTAGAKHPGCGTKVACEKLDEAVWEWFVDLAKDPDKIEKLNKDEDTGKHRQGEIERIDGQLEEIKKKWSRLLRFVMEADDLDTSDIQEELRELKEQGERLSELKESIQESLERENRFEYSQDLMKETISLYLTRNDHSFEQKRDLIRSLIKEIRVNDEDNIDIFTF